MDFCLKKNEILYGGGRPLIVYALVDRIRNVRKGIL